MIAKKQLLVSLDHFESYCNKLPKSEINSAEYNIKLITAYLLPILVIERQSEPTVLSIANQFVSFM